MVMDFAFDLKPDTSGALQQEGGIRRYLPDPTDLRLLTAGPELSTRKDLDSSGQAEIDTTQSSDEGTHDKTYEGWAQQKEIP